jgi:hypothetical protein
MTKDWPVNSRREAIGSRLGPIGAELSVSPLSASPVVGARNQFK